MKKEELKVFAMAKVCMDTYKSRYDKAKAKKEERFKNLNRNFVPGSPMFVAERDKITPEYKAEVDGARGELLKEFEDAFMRTVAHEKAAVSVITGSTKEILATLKYLEDMPVSVDEYTALTDSFGGKMYWLDRFFEKIADKNGIAKTGVQPSLTVKMEILETLSANVREFLNEYDGERKNFIVTSSDKYLFDLEDKYTNGYSGVYLNDKEQAKRMVSKAMGKGDSLERSCALANMLRTSEPDIQHEILSLLAEGEHPALSDPTMNLIGTKDVVDRFKKENTRNIKAADVAMEKVKGAKSHKERIGIIYDNLNNRHFVKTLEKHIADTSDKALKESYENMQEVRREQESETK